MWEKKKIVIVVFESQSNVFSYCNQGNKILAKENIYLSGQTALGFCSLGQFWQSNDKPPGSAGTICGVTWDVDVWVDSSWSFLHCGKIFDFGILRIIRFEISLLIIITSEPINIMYKHMA